MDKEIDKDQAAELIAKSIYKCFEKVISQRLKNQTKNIVNDLNDKDNLPANDSKDLAPTATPILNKGLDKVKNFLKKRKVKQNSEKNRNL
jgi:hypothetical protein